MPIKVITGRPGHGKSFYAVHALIEELVSRSDSVVVTNVALKLDRLNEYIQERYPEAVVDVNRRVVILDSEQTRQFFLHRRPGDVVTAVDLREAVKDGVYMKFDHIDGKSGRVCYFIDEAHQFYNARQWTKNGLAVGFYLSQHRKFNDDVYLITQHLEKLDKQLRLDIGEFVYMRNLRKTAKKIRRPGDFVRAHYDIQPTRGDEEADAVHTMKLDVVGLGSCYNTAAGVGVAGESADTLEKPKGKHWTWLLVIGAGLVLVALLGLFAFFKASSWGVAHYLKPLTPAASGSAPVPSRSADVSRTNRTARAEAVDVYIVAVSRSPLLVVLSDGREYGDRDRELEMVTPEYVVVDGKRIHWRRSRSSTSSE